MVPMSERSEFDISKITGPYQLLGAFLLVVEAILILWMRSAEHMVERIVAGILMALIFLYFLHVVRSMKNEEEETRRISPPGLRELTVAQEVTTEEEMHHLEPDKIGAPDGSYTINKPPQGWSVHELSMDEWIRENLLITDPSVNYQLFAGPAPSSRILSLRSKAVTSIAPVTGKTIISGRKYPSALQISIPIRLGIIPVERYQPPLFTEFPFEHNFMLQVSEAFKTNLMKLYDLKSGIIKSSSLRFMEADLRQEIENAIVNGIEDTSVNSNLVIIGIEGELQDYLLVMSYPSLPEANDPALEKDLETLMSIISSFRPLKTIDPDKKHKELQEKADRDFMEFIAENGALLFFSEFNVALLRLSGSDMEDPQQRLEAIHVLRPFETFANSIGLHDRDLEELWGALHEAEKGNASDLKDQVAKLIAAAKGKEGTKGDPEGINLKEVDMMIEHMPEKGRE